MVSFDNVVLNQRVEVRMRAGIYKGTVKYKGPINGVPGDWIGVALDLRVGQHDGMVNGRRYFSCVNQHGMFTLAHHVRFSRTRRCLYNKYRTVKKNSIVDEHLFDTTVPEAKNGPHDPVAVDRPYSSLARAGSLEDDQNDPFAPESMKYLRGSISSFKPPAAMRRPATAKAKLTSYQSTPMYYSYDYEVDEFVSKPTIPKTHMPREALQQQVKRGWDSPQVHLVREWTDHTGRESLRKSFWNDF